LRTVVAGHRILNAVRVNLYCHTTSISHIVGQHNKIGDIIFEAALVLGVTGAVIKQTTNKRKPQTISKQQTFWEELIA
jgi:hypothetical protein